MDTNFFAVSTWSPCYSGSRVGCERMNLTGDTPVSTVVIRIAQSRL